MEQMVNVFVMGKKYEVPASLTIMKALEYAGYKLVRGCAVPVQQFTGSRVTENCTPVWHAPHRW